MKLNVDLFYPIGSIYMNINDISPEILFGGIWEKIEGRFLIGSGSPSQNNTSDFGIIRDDELKYYNFILGNSGGEYNHTLTINEMPSHSHGMSLDGYPITGNKSANNDYNNAERTMTFNINDVTSKPKQTNSTGDSKYHNNIPPYLVVNMWKRIS